MNYPLKPFLETIYHLRANEHITLYEKLKDIPNEEKQEVIVFLKSEYEKESVDYPFTPPAFSSSAALWAAKTIYAVAQLFVYREKKPAELHLLVPPYIGSIDASVMLSADLCLRFLPKLKNALEEIDVNDPLIPLVEQHLKQFPYSAIDIYEEFFDTNIETIIENNCLKQLYLDRITERKAAEWAEQPDMNSALLANLGNYQSSLWREFTNQISTP
ncbi:hypothetical protein [Emticicia sp. 21SJ11W-3]|uniref:hypothetical protein n=1 Tax=Emticicia sp. 21SJ11W-3 TaxID=2916755 RepID=UPI00209CC3A0|nr:hypothetical protein [Emticicia sp. 21SJ11W-3]UTA66945.1 hypothetical protein MB380_15185 [Emticicia sp. 21SJ11W-3]